MAISGDLCSHRIVPTWVQYVARVRTHRRVWRCRGPIRARVLFVCVVAATLAACSSTPINYQGLASASQLQKNAHDDGHVPFLYEAPAADLTRYSAVILDPVAIYSGPDAQFGSTLRGAGREGQQAIADYMRQQFAAKLASKYTLIQEPAPDAIRVHVTLTGIESNIPVLSLVTQLSPYSVVINGVMTAADKQESLSGSVSYAVEVRDSETNALLRAFVSKQYPWAENPFVRVGSYDAARAGVRNGADALLAQLGH